MYDFTYLICFSTEDGHTDIRTVIDVLEELDSVLNASLNLAAEREKISSPNYKEEKPTLEARVGAVQHGSVEFLIDLAVTGLNNVHTFFDTLALFFSLSSPYLVSAADEIAKGVLQGVGSMAIGAVAKERMRRFEKNVGVDEPANSDMADTRLTFENLDSDLLDDFFIDSTMINGIEGMRNKIASYPGGLNFSIKASNVEVYSYAPLFPDGVQASSGGPVSVSFENRPATVIWRPDIAKEGMIQSDTPQLVDDKVCISLDGTDRCVKLDNASLSNTWPFSFDDIKPGSQVEVMCSGESIYDSTRQIVYSRNIVINEIIGIREPDVSN